MSGTVEEWEFSQSLVILSLAANRICVEECLVNGSMFSMIKSNRTSSGEEGVWLCVTADMI